MKCTIVKNKLLNALNTVCKAVQNKNPNAILTGIKLELSEAGLTLIGSDSDLTISSFLPVSENNETIITVFQSGSVVVSGKYILDIVRKLDCDIIEFDLVETSLMKIRDNISDFSLNTMRLEDYPLIDFAIVGSILKLPSETLRTIIEQTAFAASDKETRPILTGVNFKGENRHLECVATDSYRLARKVIEMESDLDFNVTIPSKILIEVGKIMESEPTVELCVSQKKIIFCLKNTQISVRLISGAYPDTSKLIPPSFLYTLDTLSLSVISAIDRASLLSQDRSNFVKLSVNSNTCQISSKSIEVGSVLEKIQNFTYQGDNLNISFTARYVIDAIRAIGSENIRISLNGEMKTFIITNKEDDSLVQLIQPVRTY